MSTPPVEESGREKDTQVPEWEHTAANGSGGANRPRGSRKAGFSSQLDKVIPPHKRYLGLSRKVFLLVLLAVFLALLALIIGLAVGLTSSR